MDCSTPGLLVHQQLPEFTQTHVHWVSNAIQLFYPLSSTSPSAFNLSQHQGLFQWVSSSDYCTISLILHASKVMLKILQARLQQYMNWELPDVQAGFRKGRGIRDQIVISVGSEKKQENSRKTSISTSLCSWLCGSQQTVQFSSVEPLTVWITTNCSVQLLSPFWLSMTPWTATCQASLSLTNSQSLLKLMSIGLVMPSNHLNPLSSPSPLAFNLQKIRVFSSESVLHIRWPKYWSFSFSISPSNEYSRLISFRLIFLISLWFKGLWRVFSNTTVQKHQFFSAQLSL